MPPEAARAPQPRRLRTDVLLMLANRGGNLVLAAVSTVVVARALGPSGRGSVAVGLNLTMILVQVGTAGLVAANPYFAAREPGRLAGIVTNALWLSATLGAVLVGAGLAVHAWIPGLVHGLDLGQVLVVLVAIPASLAMQFFQSILLGEGRTVSYNAVEVSLNALLVAALIVGFAAFDAGVTFALVAYSAHYFVGAAIYLGLGLRHAPRLTRPDLRLARRMLAYGFRVYVATLAAFVVIRLDLLLVNAYLGRHAAGLYSIAVAIADAMYIVPTVVALNLFPRVARGAAAGSTAAIFRTVAVLYAALCALSAAVASPAIRLLLGHQFAGAATLYYWLVPGTFALGMINVLAYHFAGRGYPREAVLVWLPGLALNLVMNIALLHDGAYIASLASTVAYALILVLHMRLFARESGGYRELRPHLREVVGLLRATLSPGRP